MNPTYLVAAGVLRKDNKILMVKQKTKYHDFFYWSLPGGVVESNEPIVNALSREIAEETGLKIDGPFRLIYISHLDRSDVEGRIMAFVFEVTQWSGEIKPADPDRSIVLAEFADVSEALKRFSGLIWETVKKPISAYLLGECAGPSLWTFTGDLEGNQKQISQVNV